MAGSMQKIQDEYTGDVSFRFKEQEWKKVRWMSILGGSGCILCLLAAGYAVFSAQSLQAENNLYRNQLKMAQEKLDTLEEKIEGVAKVSGEVQSIVQGQQGTGTGAELAGTGGASTVPDVAKKGSPPAKTPGDLLAKISQIDDFMDDQMKMMVTVRASLLDGAYAMRSVSAGAVHERPSGWPVYGEISSEYGWRTSPGGIGSAYHEGVDIATNYNVPVQVTADGVVTRAGWMDGYGYLVEVQHPDGMVTRYGHNSAIVVYEGQQLHQGDTVALAGSTGNSTGPHCHYEVRVNGASVDPRLFL